MIHDHSKFPTGAALLLFLVVNSHAADMPLPRLQTETCLTAELRDVAATCYRFFAEENRDQPNGTVVELPVAVIPAPGDPATADEVPLFYFPGGPGISLLDSFEWVREDVGNRPLVIVEHRGFANAKPTLACPGTMMSPYSNHLSPVNVSSAPVTERLEMHAESIEQCHDKLIGEGIDVSRYNEYEIARDTDDVRSLLGYESITVYGSSTGGGSVLSYLRYYPGPVRAIVLGAPWFGEYRSRAAIDEYYTMKQLYTDILGVCVAGNSRCREMLPAWYYEIDRTRRQLDQKPFTSKVRNAQGDTVTLTMDGAAFMARLYRSFEELYQKLPNVLYRVQRNDYSALDDFYSTDDYADVDMNATSWGIPYGYYLAHICGDMGANRPRKDDVYAMVEREPALIGFEDNKMCAWWNTDGAVPANHNDRFYSEVPGLSLHGQVDSCCGIRWGYYVAESMPNLQVFELSGLGHGLQSPCRQRMIASFLLNPNDPVDDSCKNDVPLAQWEFE